MKARFYFTLASLLPSLATAHPGHLETEHAFMSGLLHPLGGLDHLLAMIAVGLWAASLSQKVKSAMWMVPTSFVLVMLVGFVFGLDVGSIPMTEQAIAASVLVIGLAAAWAVKVPTVVASLVVAIFAFFHGVAHGAEMGEGAATMFALGFVMSTIFLHAVGIVLGMGLTKNVWLQRTVGTVIGLTGMSFFFA